MAVDHPEAQALTSESAFAELKPVMSPNAALVEANRCLMCFDAPCTRACPTSIDVPGFIKKIASGNLRGSARVILEANIFGASCARVCPTEELCEGACVLHDLHEEPIQIGRLQRYATDPIVYGRVDQKAPLMRAGEPNGRRVALVGAGPASLSCAAELRRLGYEAVIFERQERPGGLNSYGIADYKMSHEAAIGEIEWILELGVELRCGQEVGSEELPVEGLFEEFDAVFVGVGLGGVGPIGMVGETLEGVEDSLAFIAELKTRPKEEVSLVGKAVAVIGGGNTSIDAATQARRLGADPVYLVYRRDRTAMGAYVHEQELALQDGAIFTLEAQPVEVLGDEAGRVRGIRCLRTRSNEQGSLELVEGSDFELEVDRVFRATGQSKLRGLLGKFEGLQLDGKGRVVVDDEQRTSVNGLWAGGDCISGGQEVVHAVADGKRAAVSIHRALEAERAMAEGT